MLSLAEVARVHRLRLMPCITIPRQYIYRKDRYAKKDTVDTITEPEPQRVLVRRLESGEVIEIYEYDKDNFCLYIPWSLVVICSSLVRRKSLTKLQESQFELVVKFPRTLAAVDDLLSFVIPRLPALATAVSQRIDSPNNIRPVLQRIALFSRVGDI